MDELIFSFCNRLGFYSLCRSIYQTIFALFIFFSSSICYSQSVNLRGIPFIQNYTSEVYEGGIQNWEITQDPSGRLFIANNLGLLSFNGTEWGLHSVKNHTKLRSVYYDASGKIYVGSQRDFGFFHPDNHGLLQYVSLADSLPEGSRDFDETWKIYRQEEGLYFCTFNEIYFYDGKTLYNYASNYALEISFQVSQNIYVQEWGRGLSLLKNGEYHLIENGEFFKDQRISQILPSVNGGWLISTFNDGIFTYNNGAIRPFKLSEEIPSNLIINSIKRLSNGQLAIATQNEGFFLTTSNGNLVYQLTSREGLQDNTVNFIYEDRHKNVWLALNNGLARVDIHSPFSYINQNMGIEGAGYTALKAGTDFLMGTNNGLYLWNDQKITPIEGAEGQVYSIQKIEEKILIGHHLGTFEYQSEKVKQIQNDKGVWTFLPYPNRKSTYLQGTYNGLRKVELKNNRFIENKRYANFKESSRVMAFDKNHLWITQGYKGAFRLSFDESLEAIKEIKLYNGQDGFPSDILINVFDISNELVFGSERGFFRYEEDSDEFIPYEKYNRLLGNDISVVDMDEDEVGNIYFIDNQKVGLLEPILGKDYQLKTNSFNKIKKLWNDDLGNVNVLDLNNILIGAKSGFIHYDPRKDLIRDEPTQVIFSKIINKGKEDQVVFAGYGTSKESNIKSFSYAQNGMSFRFSATHYESGDQLQYQYLMEDYEEEWSLWGTQNFKEYTNLPEGKYTFNVRAMDVFGSVSEPIKYSFTIAPPIYRTTSAYLIYTFTIGMLLFFLYRFLDKKHKKETFALAKAKNVEIQEKESALKEVTANSEAEIIKLKNEKLMAEISLKSQELTSSAMHLIQKNQLLNQIKNNLIGVSKEATNQEVSKQLSKIVRTIQKDHHAENEWKQFEENFDQVHGGFISRLKESYPALSPQELKFSAYIRMNLNTKEIANLLNISVRGVEIGRYRIRKKLELERKDNLSDFLLRF